MNHGLRFPVLTLALLAMWLLLNQSVAPGTLLLGAALALGTVRLYGRLQAPAGAVRMRVNAIAQLIGLVLADVVRSNAAVARIVLRPSARARGPGFIRLPLEVRNPFALAGVACIITATPGTSWARYDAARNEVTIHMLELVDEQHWVHLFKDRYERRLKEIFE